MPSSVKWLEEGFEVTEKQQKFMLAAIRRQRVFLVLSVTGVVIGLLFGIYALIQNANDPSYELGVRLLVAVLILLNARQNLRQYKYAQILEQLKP